MRRSPLSPAGFGRRVRGAPSSSRRNDMARLLLVAATAALLASTASAAAVLVVRSSGPSATAYPPGKALPDTHVLKLKASDTVVLLDSRGTRTLSGPGNFSVSASSGAVSGAVR